MAPAPGESALDASGLLVVPGMINAHQHLYQVGLRSIAELERATLGPWVAAGLAGVTAAMRPAGVWFGMA